MIFTTLAELLTAGNEDLGVEYKAWLDTSLPEARAKLARHFAALANHGGGYLIFGVDNATRLPQGPSKLDAALFGQDALSDIVKRYLDPPIQILVEQAEIDGVTYPVVVVPSHGQRPVIAVSDGPQDAKGRVTGIASGTIYVRVPGPESAPISKADDWNALLDRCLSHRADLLGKILRQSIDRQAHPRAASVQALKAVVEDAAADFRDQTEKLSQKVMGEADRALVLNAGNACSALGYALEDAGGEKVQLDNLRALNDRVSVAMHRYAYYGWSSFLPLNVPERAPQIRMAEIAGQEVSYLEGMRLEHTGILSGAYDYWRLYEDGVGVSIESYREDWSKDGLVERKYVSPMWVLVKLHSLLAHARLVGTEIAGVQQVIVRMDWRGLAGRGLQWDSMRFVTPSTIVEDRFAKTITLAWAELRDSYYESLRRVALPLFNLFPSVGWGEPEQWLTRELIEREFARLDMKTVRLFEESA